MATVASGGGLPPSGNGGGGSGFRLRKGKKEKGQKVTERWFITQEQQ